MKIIPNTAFKEEWTILLKVLKNISYGKMTLE